MIEMNPPVRDVAEEADATDAQPAWNWFDALWTALLDPRPLVVIAALLLASILLSVRVPQMPGQLRGEPLAADRWLTTMTETLGAGGPLLRASGMFDVLHSPLFHLLLWAAIFLLLVHTAHATWIALHFRRLPAVLDNTTLHGGDPLPMTMPFGVMRWRAALSASPVALSAAVATQVSAWATHLEQRTLRVLPSAPQSEGMDPAVDAHAPILEERLLGVRGLLETALRPLLPAGMILALLLVWWYSMIGHQFTPDPLLPGARASDAVLGVTFEYALTYPQPGVIGPVLKANKGETQRVLPLMRGDVTLDGVVVSLQPGAPSLLVRTLDDAPLLAQPGQSATAAVLGLGFPNPSSEQTLILPQHGVGMRIIRQDNATTSAADDSFVVEVFQGDSEQPIQRFTIRDSQVERIQTPVGEMPLGFVPVPMLQVQAYSAPNHWLLLPAALLLLAGALGFRRRPAFLLAQAGPWPVERSVVIIQTDHAVALETLRRVIEAEPQETP
ncbi:MAG: hypothetical protein WAU00_19180 [Caldilinea sp.]|uniref:hypothetical protein n=1 Tax=Caldilinea sp. TaxID=2293560 RepID=UPI002BE16849|nr:hypothetical protein [Caldilinea sp.]HRA67642.1 hypothetical protein [Caldilinea sp.]